MTDENGASGPYQMPSSQPMLRRAFFWGIIATVVLVIGFGTIGYFVSGQTGMIGGGLGALVGGILNALTTGSVLVANRFFKSESFVVIFFGLVMGGWVLKFVGFIVAVLLLRDQPWLNPQMMFFGIVAGILVSIAIDVVVMVKTRVPYVES